ncbi:MAG: efflux RND transporter periplasmic adaptor subunit [Candidatus Binatia bacterium]
MTKRRISLLLILAMTLITGVGIYLILSKEEVDQPKPEPVPVPVEVASITPRDFTHRLEALGTVQAIREAAVSVKVSGPVTRIPPEIELGVAVKQGALLAEIDPTRFRIELNHQEALVARARAELQRRKVDIERQRKLIPLSREELRLARAEHNRLINLLEKELIAKQEVERAELAVRQSEVELERAESGLREAEAQRKVAEAELASAQAERARAREELADTHVRAPFAGVISEKKTTLGEQVSPGTVLFRLADLTTVKLLVRIHAEDIHFLRSGTTAEVFVSGLPEPFQGRVQHIGPRADNETRTFPVEILIKKRGPKGLLPGMFARAHIPVRTYQNAILIPRSSVLTNSQNPEIFVADLEKRKAIRRFVTVGRTFGSRYLVVEGLKANDLLVVTGQNLLQDGAAIHVVGRRELEP